MGKLKENWQDMEMSTPHAMSKGIRKIELEAEVKVLALVPAMQQLQFDGENPFRVSRDARQAIKEAIHVIAEGTLRPKSRAAHRKEDKQAILDREGPALYQHLAWAAAKNLKLAPPGAKSIPDHPLFMVTPAGEAFSLIKGVRLKVSKDGDFTVKDRAKVQLAKAVATCFLPNPLGRKRVVAIDGNPCNANVNNLRWAEPVSRQPRKQRNSPAAAGRAKAARDLQRRREAAIRAGASVADAKAIR